GLEELSDGVLADAGGRGAVDGALAHLGDDAVEAVDDAEGQLVQRGAGLPGPLRVAFVDDEFAGRGVGDAVGAGGPGGGLLAEPRLALRHRPGVVPPVAGLAFGDVGGVREHLLVLPLGRGVVGDGDGDGRAVGFDRFDGGAVGGVGGGAALAPFLVAGGRVPVVDEVVETDGGAVAPGRVRVEGVFDAGGVFADEGRLGGEETVVVLEFAVGVELPDFRPHA